MKFDEPKAKRSEILQLLRKVSNEVSGPDYYRYYMSDFYQYQFFSIYSNTVYTDISRVFHLGSRNM